MKKTISILLAMLMLIPASAMAAFEVWPGYCAIPADVYYTPYPENQYITNYSPWLKNFHILSQWQIDQGHIGGEACQQIRAFDISKINPDILYFATNTTGVHKSHDGGNHWYNVTNNAVGHNINAVLCDNLDENTVYCYLVRCGVFRSRNGGQSWELIARDTDTGLEGGYGQLALDAEGNLYLGTSGGLYKVERKSDKLITLRDHEALNGKNVAGYRDIEVSPDGMHIYAAAVAKDNKQEGIETGLYVSHDGGKTWKINSTGENQSFSIVEVAVHPGEPNTIFAGGTVTYNDTQKSDPYGLYVSEDCGETWSLRYNFLYSNAKEGHEATYATFYYLKFGPKNKDGVYDLYYCARNAAYNLRVSHDYGKTFEPLLTEEHDLGRGTTRHPFGDPKVYTGYLNQDFALHPTKPGVLWYPGPGIYKYDNGTFTWSNGGFAGAGVTDIEVNSEGKLIIAAMDTGAHITEAGTFGNGNYPAMKMIPTADRSHSTNVIFDPNDPNHVLIYEGNANGNSGYYGVRQSFNCGHNWDKANEDSKTALADVIGSPGNPTVFMYDPFDSNTIYTSYCISHDNGKTWEKTNMFIFAISTKDTKKQIGMSGEGTTSQLHISYDGGETWKYLAPLGETYFHSAFFDDNDDNYVWFCTRKRIAKLNVTTGEITDYTSMFGHKGFKGLYANPENPQHLIVATYFATGGDIKYNPKMVETRDGGQSWHAVPGIVGEGVQSVTFVEGTTQALVGTMAGAWIYDYAEFWKYLDSKITIEIDGQEKSFDEQPVIVNGRVMVPMRGLFETLGATVTYDDATRSIKAVKDGKYIILTIGSDKATINGKEITLEAPPYITSKGRTMVPIRFASEALNLGVGWSQANRKVIISS